MHPRRNQQSLFLHSSQTRQLFVDFSQKLCLHFTYMEGNICCSMTVIPSSTLQFSGQPGIDSPAWEFVAEAEALSII